MAALAVQAATGAAAAAAAVVVWSWLGVWRAKTTEQLQLMAVQAAAAAVVVRQDPLEVLAPS